MNVGRIFSMTHFIVEIDSMQSLPPQFLVLTVKLCAITKTVPQLLYEVGIRL